MQALFEDALFIQKLDAFIFCLPGSRKPSGLLVCRRPVLFQRCLRRHRHGSGTAAAAALFMCLLSYMTISQEEVYITDWWLSPEVYLKRGHEVEPGSQADYRLDKLLKKKAVRIFKCHERCNVFAYTLLPP